MRGLVIALLLVSSMTATAWACPAPQPSGEMWSMIGIGLLLPVSLLGSLIAVVGSWDRWLPQDRIPPTGIDRIARRVRLSWAIVVGLLVVPSYAFTPFLAVAIGPFALLVRAQLAIWRLRRQDVCVLAGARHVVIVCRGANPIWLRASPRLVAQCAMPRATIVRS